MKITHIAEKINLNQVMDISVDVHKDTLNFFFASAGREYTDICSNRTDVIQRRITKSEIHKIGHFFPSENVHQLTPISGIWETAKCNFMDKLL